jgi:ankyrin repeat protein
MSVHHCPKRNGRFTALHIAAKYGDVELVRVLLDHGAEVGAKTKNDETAFQLASGERKR